MTDTIGRGDIDVDPTDVSRRRKQTGVALAVAAVLAAAIALVPTVRGDLAGRATSWLETRWALRGALDAARNARLSQADLLLGVSDAPLFVQLVRDVDDDEARQLAALASTLQAHHTWGSDVAGVRDAMTRAIRSDANDLRAESRNIATEEAGSPEAFLPSALSSTTEDLANKAQQLLARAVRRHHIRPARAPRATIQAGADIVARLHRLTDVPLKITLIVNDRPDSTYVGYDLRTGRRLTLPNAVSHFESSGNAVVGGALLGQIQVDWELAPLASDASEGLPPAQLYVPAGSSALWRLHDQTVQKVSTGGEPLGPVRSVPDTGILAASGDWLLMQDSLGNDFLLRPADGRRLSAPGTCNAVAVGKRFAAIGECDGGVVSIDLTTGHRRLLPTPSGTAAVGLLYSPDGGLLTMALGDPAFTDDVERLAMVDMRSGSANDFPDPFHGRPVGWSADGSTLILDGSSPFGNQGTARSTLAYWVRGTHQLGSIRISDPGVFGPALVAP